jgi:drug/metabolite transporter (DMT)-like permease
MKGILALSGFLAFTLLGNFFFKRGATDLMPVTLSLGTVVAAVHSVAVWLGVIFYGLAAVFWFVSLSLVPLNLAITVSACVYVLVVMMAFLIFGEPIPLVRWAGIGMIFFGLVVVGRTL